MNSFQKNYRVILLCIFTVSGCAEKQRRDAAEQDTTTTPPAAEMKLPVVAPPINPPEQMQIPKTDSEQPDRQLAEKVTFARSNNDIFAALEAMNQLMASWNPRGIPREAVLNLLGPPDKTNVNNIEYIFDHGRGGWEWTFVIQDGVVTEVLKKSLD